MRPQALFARVIVFVGLIVFAGCAQSKSSAIGTSEFYATFRVNGDSSSTVECYADFAVGGAGGTVIDLDGDDTVECSDGTATVPMVEESTILGTVSYKAGSGLTYDASRTYTITLKRKDGESHSGTAALPTAMDVLSPASSAQVTKNTAMNVTWTATASEGVDLELSWESSDGGSGKSNKTGAEDSGTYTFDATATQTTGVTGDVSGTLKLTRTVAGTHPSTLKGTTKSTQSNTVSVTLKD